MKIVFFIETDTHLTKVQASMLDVAAHMANTTSNDVYYVNHIYEEDIKRVEESCLNICDVEEFDFGNFDDAVFVVPANYLFFLLARAPKDLINNAKLLLYFYDDLSLKKLFNQCKVSCPKTDFVATIKHSGAYVFSDRKAFYAISNEFGIFTEKYFPYTIPISGNDIETYELISTEEINIAYFGSINSKGVNAIKAICDNIISNCGDRKVNFHIVGDAFQLLKNDFSMYSPQIRFLMTGELKIDVAKDYLRKNTDIVIASDEYALQAATFNIPVIIPIMSIKPQNDDCYVYLSDVDGYYYEWDRQQLLLGNNKRKSISEIIDDIYLKNKKLEISNKCYRFFLNTVDINKITNDFIQNINKTSLTIEMIRGIQLVEQQLETYNDFVKINNNASYKMFLENKIVKQTKTKKDVYEAIKRCLSNIYDRINTNKERKSFLKIQKGFNKKKKEIKKEIALNKKVKVAFIVVFNSVFPTRPIFELMLNDSSFDPYIIIAPNVSRTFKYQLQIYNEAYDSLSKEYPGRVINGYDKDLDNYYELKDDYKVVFFCNPYKHLVHRFHEISYFLDKNVLTLYSSYGFAALKFWDEVIATDFYNYLWKACVETESNLQHLKQTEKIHGINGVVTGYIKVDKMAQIIPETRQRKRILICPHHTVWGWKTLNISNFMKYKDFFVELPKLFPQVDFIFRPHPLLFPNLIQYMHWTQDDVKNYLDSILENPNMIYDNSGDYFDKFVNSDAMIHDCGSFIGEYLYTENPCCYMMKSEEETMEGLVPLGQMCMKQYYHAFSKEDIISFIQDVVICGNDSLKNQRVEFVTKELKKNYPHAAETVVSIIKKELSIR